jgi:two-component system, OmpR family, sensor histidine kinase BaeS
MRPLDVRSRLAARMVLVALLGVLVATVGSVLAVDDSLESFGRDDLQLSANHTAAIARVLYQDAPEGWTKQKAATLTELERLNGHVVVIRDADGTLVPGSAARPAEDSATAPVAIGARQVGTIALGHFAGGFLALDDPREGTSLASQLHGELTGILLVAGIFAAIVALVVAVTSAVTLSRPIRRLREAAERIEAGDLEHPAGSPGGSAEFDQLGRTLDRLAATLKRQEEIRRETVSDLAHELRTPVTGLRARIEAAQDGAISNMTSLLASMHADVLRLGRLMEDFGRLAEAQQPSLLLEKSRVDLADLARSRAAAFATYFETNNIRLMLDIEPATACGDGERLGQVVDNLLSNALRYTNPGGRVTLRVVEGPSESMVEVADTGIGIPPDQLPRVFDRFWRAEKSRSRATGGSGLGLALVRELVEAHGGRVEVQSLVDRGSRFRVYLPVEARPGFPLVTFQGRTAPDGAVVCVAALSAGVRSDDWGRVAQVLVSKIREGTSCLVVDLNLTPALDSRGVGALLAAYAELKARDGRIAVACNPDAPAAAELRRAGIDRAMPVAPDVEEAVEVIASEAGTAPAGV